MRTYLITDKDGLHKAGSGKRKLLEILKAKEDKLRQDELQRLCALADTNVLTLTAALKQQAEHNEMPRSLDAFVLASDIEGLLLDTVGQMVLPELLGPAGQKQIDRATEEHFAKGPQGKEDLASWLGSKGWNSDGKKSNKAKSHVPAALLREHLDTRAKIVPGCPAAR
ncbi:hypothetical protein ACQCX5_03785 [Propionibacteriaceae bacterium G57]|uniref:hypothetical protein n=1 Tax=Aestuariimicrobium sp. G57 TaxID=3418485 RepID=UPI003DA70577